jgi:YihY family inner membrane protein
MESHPPVSGQHGAAWTEGSSRSQPASAASPDGVGGAKDHAVSTFRYLFSPEVHVYASSIAANALLTFFPFVLIVLTVCRRWLHWENAFQVTLQLLRANLPTGADFVVRNLLVLVQGHRRLQVMSVAMILFTASGIFRPLEIALNKVWSIERNRNYLHNQAVSLLLTVIISLLVLSAILVIAGAKSFAKVPAALIATGGPTTLVWRGLLEAVLLPCLVAIFFVTYYALPNGKVPAGPLFSAALVTGLVTEAGKFVYQLTLPLFKFREVYGPFALSVTLLFWAFLGALVLLAGAHLSARIYFRNRAQLEPVRRKPVTAGSRILNITP